VGVPGGGDYCGGARIQRSCGCSWLNRKNLLRDLLGLVPGQSDFWTPGRCLTWLDKRLGTGSELAYSAGVHACPVQPLRFSAFDLSPASFHFTGQFLKEDSFTMRHAIAAWSRNTASSATGLLVFTARKKFHRCGFTFVPVCTRELRTLIDRLFVGSSSGAPHTTRPHTAHAAFAESRSGNSLARYLARFAECSARNSQSFQNSFWTHETRHLRSLCNEAQPYIHRNTVIVEQHSVQIGYIAPILKSKDAAQRRSLAWRFILIERIQHPALIRCTIRFPPTPVPYSRQQRHRAKRFGSNSTFGASFNHVSQSRFWGERSGGGGYTHAPFGLLRPSVSSTFRCRHDHSHLPAKAAYVANQASSLAPLAHLARRARQRVNEHR